MREIRTSGAEGGGTEPNRPSLPLSEPPISGACPGPPAFEAVIQSRKLSNRRPRESGGPGGKRLTSLGSRFRGNDEQSAQREIRGIRLQPLSRG